MTAETKDNLTTAENTEKIAIKKKAGRPNASTSSAQVTNKKTSAPKVKVSKEKKLVKKTANTSTSSARKTKVEKKAVITEPVVSKPEYSDDEEISIGINIKGKIRANVDELIATTETLGVEKTPEIVTPVSPVEKVIAESKNIEIKKEAEIVVPVANPITPETDKKIVENAIESEDGMWSVQSDAVKRVIAAAQAEKSSEEIVQTTTPPPAEHESGFKISAHAIGIYKKIAYFFAVLLIAVGAAVFYFTFIHVKIVLIPSQERMSNNTIFDVIDTDKSQSEETPSEKITGIVKETTVTFAKKYPATSEEVLGKEVIGRVKLVNNYIKNQPLVASTRLLSTDGKLFRLKNTVDIPVNGSVEAEIYADDPSPEMAIGASKFTIPGLWAGLQDKIYAESTEAAIYQQKVKKTISEDDIKNGVKDLKQELLNKAKQDINDTYSNYDKIIYKIDENSISTTVNNKVGEEISEFEIGMEAKVVIVAFSNKIFAEIAKEKLIKSLPENKELVSFDSENINYSLNNFNVANGNASLSASFEGMVTLENNSNVIDKEKLIGLNKEQINAYLNNIDKTANLDLAGHEIQFYPSFITKIPTLIEPGRIEIEIRK